MEEEKQKNRKAMVLVSVGCLVLLFLFGCLPLGYSAWRWLL